MEPCKCERKCFDKVPQSTRNLINEGYQNLLTNNERSLYLYGLIFKTVDRNDPCRIRSLFKYHVRVDGFHVEICQKAFVNIHGVTLAKVRTLTQKLNDGVIFPQDLRCGENGTLRRRLKPEVQLQVKDHIHSILKNDIGTKNEVPAGYVPNVTRMWNDYVSKCRASQPSRHLMDNNLINFDEEINKHVPGIVSRTTYAIIFREVFSEFTGHSR